MGVKPPEFRDAMAHWASGVTVVTTCHMDMPLGMTVSSFASVSLHPAQVLVCINHKARAHEVIVENGYFAINLLGVAQIEWGIRFAGMRPEITNRFEGIEWYREKTGAPILPSVLSWFDCTVCRAFPSGDHTIFVGEVAACGGCGGEPLLYHNRGWYQLAASHVAG